MTDREKLTKSLKNSLMKRLPESLRLLTSSFQMKKIIFYLSALIVVIPQ